MNNFEGPFTEKQNLQLIENVLYDTLRDLPKTFPSLFGKGVDIGHFCDGAFRYWKTFHDKPGMRIMCVSVSQFEPVGITKGLDSDHMPFQAPEYQKGLVAVDIYGVAFNFGGQKKFAALVSLFKDAGLEASFRKIDWSTFLFVDLSDPKAESKLRKVAVMVENGELSPSVKRALTNAKKAEMHEHAQEILSQNLLGEVDVKFKNALDEAKSVSPEVAKALIEEFDSVTRKNVDKARKLSSHRSKTPKNELGG